MGDLLSPPALAVLYLATMADDTQKMQTRLVEPGLLAIRRDRAQRMGFQGQGDFLHHQIASILADRLAEVTRPFRNATLIGSGGGVYHDALRTILPDLQLRQFDLSQMRAENSGSDRLSDYDVLPLETGSQDLILSALELHWLDDPVGHLIQIRRALRPDGLMIAAMFGGATLQELRAALAEAEIETTGGLSPRIAPMGELRDLGALLQRAGLAMPVADSDRFRVSYQDATALMRDLRLMGETNVLAERRRVPMRKEMLTRCNDIYAASFPTDDGRIRATFEVIFLTGWAPGPDQPQPRRPGSATARLADALGTKEQSAGDAANPGFAIPGPSQKGGQD